MLKKILFALLIVALLVGGAIYYVFNKPHRDIAGSEADFAVAAPALLHEFETDENTANQKYLDKIISVKGKIAAIETTADGYLNITLDAGSEMSTVSCSMLPSEKGKAAKYKTGDEVTIKGLCTGMLMDVVLTNCTFINS